MDIVGDRKFVEIPGDAMMELPICSFVRCSSCRITGINGASPNQPKKHRKKASHVIWKVRIGALRKSSRRIAVAFLRMFTS